MAMRPSDETGVERILVVSAHPDDVDFGAAGSVATWTDAGIHVAYCLVTDGDAGGSDNTITRARMAEIRRAEQTAAAATVGVHELHFLGYPDGRVTASLDLRRDLSRVIRRVRPDRVCVQSPERRWDRIYASHPDHLAAGEAALAAVYPDARNEFAHPELLAEGFAPWTAREVYVIGHPQADVHVDITAQIDRKIAALLAHESQHADPVRTEELVRVWSEVTAQAAGLPEGRRAEAFLRVDTA
ncbi:MAG: hypothetical protein RL531_1016 [Actinomycetota bacterium]|jgi:LmbE family N-acetylglucosaminyl deacetylase